MTKEKKAVEPNLVHPPQSFNQQLHLFHILTHNVNNLFLHGRLTDQEPFDQISVDKPERLASLPGHGPECPELVEGDTAERVDAGCHSGLEAHQEVLVFWVYYPVEVD